MSVLRACWVVPMIVALALAGCGKHSPPASGGKVRVVASIFPLGDLVRQIGGERVDVGVLLGPGLGPHDFSPRAEQSEQVERAQLLVLVGLGIDAWAERIAGHIERRIPVLKVAEAEQFRASFGAVPPGEQEHEADHEHAHEHGRLGADPHVWLDPVYMQCFAEEICRELCRLDGDNADEYRRRLGDYLGQLRELDREYARTLSAVKSRGFVTFHEAFQYVARRYGLTEMALQNVEAADFGPAQVERVVRFIRENHVRAIFVEPEYPPERLEELARQTGARLYRLDDIGNPNVAGYDSYLAMMRSNLKALAEGLGQ